jgi:hypothetical protein
MVTIIGPANSVARQKGVLKALRDFAIRMKRPEFYHSTRGWSHWVPCFLA